MTITAEIRSTGEKIRLTLPTPIWTGREELSPGVWLTALYLGKRSGRMVAEFDSAWINPRTGYIDGTSYEVINADRWVHYCDIAQIEPGLPAEAL